MQIREREVSASLAYAHYDIARSYTLSDVSDIEIAFDPIGDQVFWHNYLDALQQKFNWKFIVDQDSDGVIDFVKSFEDEGVGVAALKFVIDVGVQYRGKLLGALRALIPTAQIEVVEEKKQVGLFAEIANKLGYSDVLHVHMDVHTFKAARILPAGSKSDKYSYDNTKINWSSENSLIESIYDSRLRAFAADDYQNQHGVDQWANFVLNPTRKVSSKILRDMIRSYIAVQCMSMLTNQQNVFKDFGAYGSKSLLVLTGNLLDTISSKNIILTLIDAFQLRGEFDVMFDTQDRWTKFGRPYVMGINSSDYIVTRTQVLDRLIKVLSLDVPGNPDKPAVVVQADAVNSAAETKVTYVLSGEVEVMNLPQVGKQTVVSGKAMKGAYVEGKGEVFDYVFESDGPFDQVLIDARFKPVVYGPSYRENKDNIKRWLDE